MVQLGVPFVDCLVLPLQRRRPADRRVVTEAFRRGLLETALQLGEALPERPLALPALSHVANDRDRPQDGPSVLEMRAPSFRVAGTARSSRPYRVTPVRMTSR